MFEKIKVGVSRGWKLLTWLPQAILILLFKAYQFVISPLFPPACRFTPTCSQYAIEAVQKYGVFKGGLKSLWRILRCHPFSQGGYDPVK